MKRQKKVGVNAALEWVIQKGLSSKMFEQRTEDKKDSWVQSPGGERLQT